jgi:hypothetical protein
MKTTLKAPGCRCLKQELEELLSKCAFKLNARRYTEGRTVKRPQSAVSHRSMASSIATESPAAASDAPVAAAAAAAAAVTASEEAIAALLEACAGVVGRCRLTLSNPR